MPRASDTENYNVLGTGGTNRRRDAQTQNKKERRDQREVEEEHVEAAQL